MKCNDNRKNNIFLLKEPTHLNVDGADCCKKICILARYFCTLSPIKQFPHSFFLNTKINGNFHFFSILQCYGAALCVFLVLVLIDLE